MKQYCPCLALLILRATTLLAGTGSQILLEARDLKNQPLAGIRFSYQGVKSARTNGKGVTELDLPPKQQTGQKIKIQLAQGSTRADEWFLVNPEVNIPTESTSAAVVLMRRSEFRQIAAAVRDFPKVVRPGDLSAEDRKQILVEEAARRGLSAEQLEIAIRSFAETQNHKDKGIAAYLEGQYADAEKLLARAAEKKESDLVETLSYLGATQYEEGRYKIAAESFRKAIALRGDDGVLLSWLGLSFLELAEWSEAEPLMRRALTISEKSLGTEHPNVATGLNNLATLLQNTNRLAEAEPLMRRALAINEKSLGTEHPTVAIHP